MSLNLCVSCFFFHFNCVVDDHHVETQELSNILSNGARDSEFKISHFSERFSPLFRCFNFIQRPMERDFSTFSALFRGSEVTRKLRGKKLVNEIDSWQQTIGRNTTLFRQADNMLLCLHFCTICPLKSTSREISFSSVIFIQTIKWLYLI